MAISKAKEHLAAAEMLYAAGKTALAYGHLVFALEEAGKGAIRLLVDLGVYRWGDVIDGLTLEERRLSDAGSHEFKSTVGGALGLAGAIREVLAADKDELLAAIQAQGSKNIRQMAATAAENLFPKIPKLLTPDYLPILRSAQAMREAAFYSGSKKPGAPIPTEPSSKDYSDLVLPVRGAVEGLAFLDRPPDPRVVDFVAAFVQVFLPEAKRYKQGSPT